MKNMIKGVLFGSVVLLLTALALTGCTSTHSSSTKTLKAEQKSQAQITKRLEHNQPVPQFNYSQLRQNLIEVKDAEAKGVQTTSFFFQMGDKDPVYSCPSIGAPIDASDQLTNPNQIITQGSMNSSGGNVVIDQMDPTGEYSTGGSSGATYVLCLGADGESHALYWEGQVMSVFAPAVWEPETGTRSGHIKITGRASYNFSESKARHKKIK
jgi:hypothetical protein